MAEPAASDNMQTSQIICKWMWGRWRMGGVGMVEGGEWSQGQEEEEEESGGGKGLTLPGSFLSSRRRWRRRSHLPGREAHFLELMEARGHVSAGGNTPQVASAHHSADQYHKSGSASCSTTSFQLENYRFLFRISGSNGNIIRRGHRFRTKATSLPAYLDFSTLSLLLLPLPLSHSPPHLAFTLVWQKFYNRTEWATALFSHLTCRSITYMGLNNPNKINL